jgi:hypothetical protein
MMIGEHPYENESSEESYYTSTLLKLSYLLYQYYPIESEDI